MLSELLLIQLSKRAQILTKKLRFKNRETRASLEIILLKIWNSLCILVDLPIEPLHDLNTKMNFKMSAEIKYYHTYYI